MFNISRLRLNLPTGFEQRAARIARLVGQELVRLPVTAEMDVAALSVRGVEVSPSHSDRHVAARIASAIHRQAHNRQTHLPQG